MKIDKTNAFRYLFEILVIVFSVTISFYIQEVLDDKEKEELKNDSLRGMLDDLDDTESAFGTANIYFNERIAKAEKIIETKKVTSEDILWIKNGWDWYVTNTSYQSLIATGAAEYINNEGLYKEIVSFYNQNSLLGFSKEYTAEAVNFKNYLTKNYKVKSMITAEQYYNQRDWPTEIFNDYDDNSLNRMVLDDVFNNYIYNLKKYNVGMLFWLRLSQEKLLKLRESIKKEIKPSNN